MYFIVAYDVPEDKRRTKIHKILKSYGHWVQYSLFECDLTEAQYAKLRARLQKWMKPDEDRISFVPLCACCQGKIERIGAAPDMDTTIFFA